MAKILFSTVTLLALTVSASTVAQQIPGVLPDDLPVEEAEEVRYYSVEVVVFEYTDAASAGNEVFDPEPSEDEALQLDPFGADMPTDIPVYGDDTLATPLPDVSDIDGISQGDFAEPAGDSNTAALIPDTADIDIEEVPSLTSFGFRLLQPEEKTMSAIHEKLMRLDAYRPLVWGGWIQAAVDEETTLPVKLRMLGTTPLNLSGDLTLYLKNYLHLVVNLGLEQQVANIEPEYRQQDSTFGGRQREKSFGDKYNFSTRDWQVIRFAIEEDRIFNSGHLRYFDHPRFGVLVRVNRFEMPEDENPDDDDRDSNAPTLDAG